jgi:hypothetical protein
MGDSFYPGKGDDLDKRETAETKKRSRVVEIVVPGCNAQC